MRGFVHRKEQNSSRAAIAKREGLESREDLRVSTSDFRKLKQQGYSQRDTLEKSNGNSRGEIDNAQSKYASFLSNPEFRTIPVTQVRRDDENYITDESDDEYGATAAYMQQQDHAANQPQSLGRGSPREVFSDTRDAFTQLQHLVSHNQSDRHLQSNRFSSVTRVEETHFDSQYPSTTDGIVSQVASSPERHQDDIDEYADESDDNDKTASAGFFEGNPLASLSGMNMSQAVRTEDHELNYAHKPNNNVMDTWPGGNAQTEPLPQDDDQSGNAKARLRSGQPTTAPVAHSQKIRSATGNQENDFMTVPQIYAGHYLPSPASITKSASRSVGNVNQVNAFDIPTDADDVTSQHGVGVASTSPLTKFQQSQSPDMALDYDKPELFRMEFKSLAEEDFDYLPNKMPCSATEEKQFSSLGQRLAHFAKLGTDRQQEFFASLSKAEWEQCGEWFTEQYSGLMRKMRKSREERRSLARRFENEVTKRHHAVEAEKASLHDSLKKMKSSGTTVLSQGTPQRKPS